MPAVDTAAGSWGGTGIIRYSRHWEEIMARYENTSSQVSFGKDTTLTKSHLVISRTDPSLSCKTPKHESGMLVLLKDKRLPRPSPPLTKRDSRCSLFLLAGLPVLKKKSNKTHTQTKPCHSLCCWKCNSTQESLWNVALCTGFLL